jgi:filamentous hemagglutinin
VITLSRPRRHSFSASLLVGWLLLSPAGFVGTATSPFTATDTLRVTSGSDTTFKGAQVAARSVAFDVGKDLLIETLQDSSVYESKQSNSGFNLSICVPPICVGVPVTGSLTLSQQTLDHNYLSAVGQSGIAAGDGGFDLNVNGKTDLVGAAVTGSRDPDKNRLTTARLTSRDLQNAQQTEADSFSLSLAYTNSDSMVAGNITNNLLANLQGQAGLPKEGSESGTTHSVISPATITLTGSGDAAQDAQSRATADTLTTRDPATANGALKNTLTLQQAQALQAEQKRRQENQLAAQYVGAVVTNVIGDVAKSQSKTLQAQENARAEAAGEEANTITAWKDGSPEKIALHGLAGLIQAKVGGTSAAAGVTAGMTHEALVPLMDTFLREQGFSDTTQESKKEFDTLMNAGSVLLGAAVGAAASGNVQGAASGASVALIADINNRALHEDEQARIEQLAGNDPVKKARLSAAACALVNCYAEYPPGSAVYNTLKKLAEVGASDDLKDERDILQSQKNLFTYSTTGILSDQKLDAARLINNTYQITTRALGAVETVAGGAGLAAAAATAPASCATGVGCIANGVVAVSSLDALLTGSKQVVSGQSENTMMNQALQGMGMTPEMASAAELILGLGAAVKAGAVMNTATAAQANASAAARQSYDDFAKFGGAKGESTIIRNFAEGTEPNLVVNLNQQNKHIVGTNEYKTASQITQRSPLASDIDPQVLVNQYAGTGQAANKVSLGQPGSVERITTNQTIGIYYENGVAVGPTTNFTIRYGKDGVHIIPARP